MNKNLSYFLLFYTQKLSKGSSTFLFLHQFHFLNPVVKNSPVRDEKTEICLAMIGLINIV